MELLIAVVVIAILAAITIVSFNGITTQASVAALMSDLKTAATQLNATRIGDGGDFPSTKPSYLSTKISYIGGGSTFCVFGEADSRTFYGDENGHIREGSCPPPSIMQAMTPGHCVSMPTYDGSNPTAVFLLTDNRGGTTRTYEIAKLADGKCWMLTNLKLGSTSGSITLTPSDSDVTSSFTLPQLTTGGSPEHDLPRTYGPVPGDTGSGATNYGYLERGVTLVSAKENFGDGYMGDAMEAITDVVNELQVRMSGEDIKIKMAHKVERGGTVGRAKRGYVNARKDFDGRLVNTIDVDPVRAPLITWAFEQYATGQHSVAQLQMMMEDQGLTTRPSSKRPARPISKSQLAMILRDPYYTGIIRYKGKVYPGRHQPLIPKELFLKVQEILSTRNRRGDRDRTHFHYLRGLLYCGECKKQGRTSRLVYSQNKGNGGVYEYYVCTAKQRGTCTMRPPE